MAANVGKYTNEERIERLQYTDGKKWYTPSGYPIIGTEGDFEELLPIASKEATQKKRDTMYKAREDENLRLYNEEHGVKDE